MRIGIDCRLWNESGVGRYTRNLVFQLLNIDSKNMYILFALPGDVEHINFVLSKVKSSNYKIVRADIRWHSLSEQLSFLNALYYQRLNLMHFPYFSIPILYRWPYVVTIHDVIQNHFPTGKASTLPLPIYYLKHMAYKFVISQAASGARKIIVPLHSTKEEVVNTLGISPKKIVVTYEGADDFVGSREKQGESGVKNILHNYFLYVGNAYPHKNLERVIEAFSKLKAVHFAPKLILVGKEDYFYKKLKVYVDKLDMSDDVIFYGFVSDEELRVLYKKAIALLAPSLMEGFGLSALEAMTSKCLVVASDIPSLREVCKNAAHYFDPYSVKDICRALQHVYGYSSSERKRRIMIGLDYLEVFSWRKMAEKTLEVYEQSFFKVN